MKKTLFIAFAYLLFILFTSAVQAQSAPAGSWSAAGSLTALRSEAAAATLLNGQVLITGGVSGGNWLSSAEIYDGNRFTPVASMAVARSNHAAATLSDGRVVVSGGYSSAGVETNSIEIYNPTSQTWIAGPAMVQARAQHTMTVLNDGRLLIAGGMGSAGPLATLEIYDPASNSCSALTVSMSSPRIEHAAAVLASGAVLLAGGFDGSNVLDTVDAYDPKAGVMYGPRQMASPRKNLSATTLIDGRVLLAGGNDGTQDLATLEIANVSTGTISVVGSLAVARSGHVAIALSNNGDVLIAGGVSSGTALSSAELFSPANSSVRSAGNMSAARSGAVAAGVQSSGHVLVAGGESSGSTSTGDLYGLPTVKTDKPEYAPNTVVTISGTGWTPGETVTLVLQQQPAGGTDVTLTAVANSSGSFQNTSFKPDVHDEQINFILTAEGQTSGVFAQTVFADATYNTQLYSLYPTAGAAGGAINATATLIYEVPEYQEEYYTYVCGSYSCDCNWLGDCDTCYDYCTYYYLEQIGTYYEDLSGQPVQFSFNNGTQVTAVTDSNGVASALLTVPAGATSLTASFGGSSDGTYGPSTAVSSFTVTTLPLLTVAATNAIGTYGQPLPPLAYTMTGFIPPDTQNTATTGVPSEGTATSPTSTPGAYPIVITPGTLAATNYGFSFVNGVLTIQQAASTVAVLSLASSVSLSQSTVLTATVSVSGSGAAPTGSVNFMSGATLLGAGTLSPIDATDSTATLNLNGSQLIAGANSITAVYSGDVNYGSSSSAATNVTLLIPQVVFGSVNVGTAAQVQTLTYSFSGETTLSAVNILTEGVSGLDYADGGSSTCAVDTPYSAGQSCVVTVAFTPSAPGLRSGGVTLFAQGSTLPLMTWYLNGVGQSGAVTIDPGTQSTIATLSNGGQAYGTAIDGGGNVYVVDHANSQVIELAAGSFTPSPVVASGLLNPTAVALDGAGNLYISDTGNSRVEMVPNEQGTLNSADMSTVNISGLGSPRGVATDGGGDLYVADATNGDVLEIPAGGGTPSTVASGLTGPHGVAVDASGDVYVASDHQVTEYPMGGGTPSTIGSGYNDPRGVAVDASGAVYVADSGNARIVWVAPGGASQANLAITGTSSPQGVAVDAAGDVYVTNSGSVYEVNRTQAAPLAFPNTSIGSTSASQTVTVSDVGNQPLTVSNLMITTNFTQVPSGGTDCTSSTQLLSAGQCLIALASAPTTSGPLAGTLTLSDNALNNPASTQAVQLSGSGSQVAQTIIFPPVATQTYGVGPLTLNATASSGLPVSYVVTSGPATVSGNVLAITGAGSVTVQACQGGNTEYAAATPMAQTFIVNQASQTITFPIILSQTYGGAPYVLNAIASSGLSVSYVVTSGPATVSGSALTITGAGSVTVQASQAGNANYLGAAPVSQTFAVNQASQTITFTQSAPAAAPYNSSFTVAATASSGLSVSFNGSGMCTNVGATFTMTNSTGTCTVTASQAGNGNYLAASVVTQSTAAAKAEQLVTFTGAPANAQYESGFTVSATSNSGITPTITVSGVCSISGTTVTMTSGTGTCTTTAKWAANNYYLATSVAQTTGAEKLISAVTWSAPAEITYGTALSGTQLDATANVGGAFVYSPAAGTLPKAGTDTLKVTFTPTLSKDYTTVSDSVELQVNQATPIITWPTPAEITYGTALSATQLDATANVAGTFAYSPAAGKVFNAGIYTLSVAFTPKDLTDYIKATSKVTLVVNKTATTTTITSILPNPSMTGKAVSVHFTVTPATSYSAPTGSVTVNASTGESCTGTLSGGSGACSVKFSTSGARTLTATYAGDSNNGTSVSAAVTQTVN